MSFESIHCQILEQVAVGIRGLGLKLPTTDDPLPDERVYLKRYPTDRNVIFPCVEVTFPVTEQINSGTNEDLYETFPVLVAIITEEIQNLEIDANADRWCLWRQLIIDLFETGQLELDGVVKPFDCDVEPKPLFDVLLFREQNRWASNILLKFKTARLRANLEG